MIIKKNTIIIGLLVTFMLSGKLFTKVVGSAKEATLKNWIRLSFGININIKILHGNLFFYIYFMLSRFSAYEW